MGLAWHQNIASFVLGYHCSQGSLVGRARAPSYWGIDAFFWTTLGPVICSHHCKGRLLYSGSGQAVENMCDLQNQELTLQNQVVKAGTHLAKSATHLANCSRYTQYLAHVPDTHINAWANKACNGHDSQCISEHRHRAKLDSNSQIGTRTGS